MDRDVFNMQIRKFLKNVGVTSQREIETAVRGAMADGRLKGDETIKAQVRLSIDSLDLDMVIDGDIRLV